MTACCSSSRAADPRSRELIARKRPSTGLVALALGLTEAGFAHAILAGFDFTLSHAYGHNPLIDQRGERARASMPTPTSPSCAAIQARAGLLVDQRARRPARTGIPLLPAVDG